MYLARKILQVDYNKSLFFLYSKLERSEMKDCFESLVKLIYSEAKYDNLERKYSHESKYKVSIIARDYAEQNFN
jgi:hypothetical protein